MPPEQLYIKILKCLVQSPKTNSELLDSLGFYNKKFNVIDKPLKKLKDDGLVLSKKINSIGAGAKPTLNSLKSDINTLRYLATSVYDDESIFNLMNSKYYHGIVQALVGYLGESTDYTFTDQDPYFLSIVLKYSPSALKLVLSNELNEKLEAIGERMDLVDFGYMNQSDLFRSAMRVTLHSTKSNDPDEIYAEIDASVRQKMIRLNETGADNKKNHYLMYVFFKIFENDLFMDKIPSSLSTAFLEEYSKMGAILKKCEDQTVYSMTPV